MVAVTRAPPLRLMAGELPRAAWGMAQLPLHWGALGRVAKGDGRPVMLLPGLFNSDASNVALRRHLVRCGYAATGWGMGRNMGPRTIGGDGGRLFDAIGRVAEVAGRPVTLVGISLGGIMARVAARRLPDKVAGVVTISAPFAGPPTATNVWRAYQWAAREAIDTPAAAAWLAEAAGPLPVRSAAIWSASDGLVAGAICRSGSEDCVEIRSSHVWVQFNAQALRETARVLASWVDADRCARSNPARDEGGDGGDHDGGERQHDQDEDARQP